MPIYEYQCEACAHQFEAIQKMSARPLRKCPECGGKVERLISKAAFVLKGGGWYADGYGGAASESSDAGGKDQSTAKEGSAKAKAPKLSSKSWRPCMCSWPSATAASKTGRRR